MPREGPSAASWRPIAPPLVSNPREGFEVIRASCGLQPAAASAAENSAATNSEPDTALALESIRTISNPRLSRRTSRAHQLPLRCVPMMGLAWGVAVEVGVLGNHGQDSAGEGNSPSSIALPPAPQRESLRQNISAAAGERWRMDRLWGTPPRGKRRGARETPSRA
jgi:hypothetical protein